MRKKKTWLVLVLLIVIAYLMGPKPAIPAYKKDMPAVPADGAQLTKYVNDNEKLHRIKKDNEARIIWYNDSLKNKTEYAMVYLHGFGASSYGEGYPVHVNIARKFKCNLYLSRLADHGLDTVDVLRKLTPDRYWESAKQALAVGRQLGNKIILVGTSTGGSIALQLAATYPNEVQALVLLSPNLAINDPSAWLLNDPWGLQLASLILGTRYVDSKDQRDLYKQYWYSHYRLEGVVALEEMLESAMTKSNFKKITQPVLMLYYYKDDVHQDSVVKVSAMLDMFDQLGTPESNKVKKAMPKAGNHVIGSYIKSNDVEGVEREIEAFLKTIIK